MLIAISFVSVAFSVHISYGRTDCDENITDCFIIDNTHGLPNITALTNCSLPFELKELDEKEVYIECFIGLQPAVFLALLGGYITFIPPLMFSFTNLVHVFIFEKCLKNRLRKFLVNGYISLAIIFISNLTPYVYCILIIVKYRERVNSSDNNVIRFIFKDTVLGQLSAIIITFSSFLSYPWFWFGNYKKNTPQEAATTSEYGSFDTINDN